MELMLPKFQNQATQDLIIMRRNNMTPLQKQFKYFKWRRFMPEGTKIIPTSKKELNMYYQHNHRKQRATILGCKTLQQASDCEQYMMTMNNKIHTEYTWHKTWKKQQWTFDLRFKNEHVRNNFIKNWNNNKSEKPTHLMIFTKRQHTTNYRITKWHNRWSNDYTWKWSTESNKRCQETQQTK